MWVIIWQFSQINWNFYTFYCLHELKQISWVQMQAQRITSHKGTSYLCKLVFWFVWIENVITRQNYVLLVWYIHIRSSLAQDLLTNRLSIDIGSMHCTSFIRSDFVSNKHLWEEFLLFAMVLYILSFTHF